MKRWAQAALTLLLGATAASAFIPQAQRVAGAIADSNAASGRAQALRIELEMRVGDGPLAARGELVTHPTGMARLELRGAGELVEKHILQGSHHAAGRNGKLVAKPRALLPPFFLLQIDSAVSLHAALAEFRIHAELVGLAPCDEHDCYVLGDPDRVPPAPPEEDPTDGEAADSGPQGLEADSEFDRRSPGSDRAALPAQDSNSTELAPAEAQPFELAPGERPPTLWADTESFDVQRMRLSGGVRVLFGPYVMFERVRVPSWLRIEEERGSVRFDVVGVTPVNAPASAFDLDWLVAPTTSPPASPQLPAGSAVRPSIGE